MKDKTIDYVLRTSWLTVSKMYNEEAAKFDSTMATGLTLLSIDQLFNRIWKRKKSLFKTKSSHF